MQEDQSAFGSYHFPVYVLKQLGLWLVVTIFLEYNSGAGLKVTDGLGVSVCLAFVSREKLPPSRRK